MLFAKIIFTSFLDRSETRLLARGLEEAHDPASIVDVEGDETQRTRPAAVIVVNVPLLSRNPRRRMSSK